MALHIKDAAAAQVCFLYFFIFQNPFSVGEPKRAVLLQELGHPVSRPVLAAEMIRAFLRLGEEIDGDHSRYLSAYRRDCVTLGRQVQLLWQGDRREVVEALDVDDQFGLVVRHDDGRTEVIRSGEVSVRGMYGYIE